MVPLLLFVACAARAPADAVALPPPPAPVAAMPADLDALLDFGDPAGSEAAYRALLPAAEAEGADAALCLWTRIARTQGLQGRFDDARATLDRTQAAAATAADPPAGAEVFVRLSLERGRMLNSGGDPARSAPLFEDALARADAAGLSGLAVDAMHMLGIVLPPDDALDWNLKAIARAEASDDPAARRWLGALYNNTGWTFMDRGEAARALPLFEKGVAWREQAGAPGPLRIARWTVARAWRELGRCEEALPVLEALQVEWEAAGSPDGYVFEELGECLWALDRKEEARPHLATAWRLLSDDAWLVEHEAERLQSLRERAGDALAPEGVEHR